MRIAAMASFTLALSALAHSSFAVTYNWVPWTFPTSTTASGNAGALGTIGISLQGDQPVFLNTANYQIQFDSVPFTPVTAPSVGAQNLTDSQNWSITTDLSAISDSSKVVIGLGNFGYGSSDYPGYKLAAFDSFNNPIALTNLTLIGSYDHEWLSPITAQFNDTIALNQVTGNFSVTTVAGLNDTNSDILLLGLPTGVARLVVSTVGSSDGDTVNIVAAVVPEPTTLGLLAAGTLGLLTRRRKV